MIWVIFWVASHLLFPCTSCPSDTNTINFTLIDDTVYGDDEYCDDDQDNDDDDNEDEANYEDTRRLHLVRFTLVGGRFAHLKNPSNTT